MNNSIKFLLIFFLSVALIFLLIGGFNWWVDPYGVYHPKEYKAKRPIWMSKQLRLAKAYRIMQLKPLGIVIGSSTSQLGIDPSHPGWDKNVVPRYNLSLPGANLYESFRYFQHTHAFNPPKQILIGLDFVSFNIFSPLSDDFNEQHMVISRDGKHQDNRLLNFGLTLFSLSAIKASQKKIIYREEGTHLYNGTEFSDKNKIELRNNRSAMMWSAVNFVPRLLLPPTANRFCLDGGARVNPGFYYLSQILEIAKEDGADVRLFIQPAHVYVLEVLKALEMMDDYKKWQLELIDLIEDVNRKYSKTLKFPLWDFSGYNKVTMDIVPPPEDPKRSMHWYYDVAHFNKSLGDMIQDRVFDYHETGRNLPNDFGVQINSQNIDQYQSAQKTKQAEYFLTNKKDIRELIDKVNLIKKGIGESECSKLVTKKYKTRYTS